MLNFQDEDVQFVVHDIFVRANNSQSIYGTDEHLSACEEQTQAQTVNSLFRRQSKTFSATQKLPKFQPIQLSTGYIEYPRCVISSDPARSESISVPGKSIDSSLFLKHVVCIFGNRKHPVGAVYSDVVSK